MVAYKTQEAIYTIEEYFELEQISNIKHEFYNGKIKEVPGGTTNHNLIASNTITELNIALRKKDKEYFVLNSDMKIQLPEFNSFVYPDALVICEKIELYENRNDVIINPLLIVEVLSPSTEGYDRGTKFLQYKTIPSFKEYLLISQKHPWVTVESKTGKNTWTNKETKKLEGEIYLESVDVKIPLKDLYRGVKFEE